jgi:hypothetical protein
MHLREKGVWKKKTYTKIKTWMLILLTLFSFIAALRYTFSLKTYAPAFYATILVLQQQFEALSYVLICWYFLANAEKLLQD